MNYNNYPLSLKRSMIKSWFMVSKVDDRSINNNLINFLIRSNIDRI